MKKIDEDSTKRWVKTEKGSRGSRVDGLSLIKFMAPVFGRDFRGRFGCQLIPFSKFASIFPHTEIRPIKSWKLESTAPKKCPCPQSINYSALKYLGNTIPLRSQNWGKNEKSERRVGRESFTAIFSTFSLFRIGCREWRDFSY